MKYSIAVFLMSAAVGVLYRIPKTLLIYGCISGTASWLVMHYIVLYHNNVILANFLGSLTVGFISEILARILKKPATIFVIPGFIPLVPGKEAYLTMLYMVRGDYVAGVSMGMKTLMIGGAIAFGIFISSTIFRLVQNYGLRSR